MAKKILIIDDDVELCEEMAEILREEGFRVHIASDGMSGQKRTSDNHYDCIILDYRMPGLNGVEFLHEIKKRKLKTKIILASGRPFLEKVLEDEKLSDVVSGILQKPFDIQMLLTMINAS
jgi:DNA-binding response OmpR family regulator